MAEMQRQRQLANQLRQEEAAAKAAALASVSSGGPGTDDYGPGDNENE
jgi:hypothetical protein